MEEMAFIASSFCFLDLAGNFPSNISRCNASEEVQVACVGGFQDGSAEAEVRWMLRAALKSTTGD